MIKIVACTLTFVELVRTDEFTAETVGAAPEAVALKVLVAVALAELTDTADSVGRPTR